MRKILIVGICSFVELLFAFPSTKLYSTLAKYFKIKRQWLALKFHSRQPSRYWRNFYERDNWLMFWIGQLLSAWMNSKQSFILIISKESKHHLRHNFFTYGTKTHANLTIYSIKPGNYNGTNFFEIDIIKKSSPINSKFTFFATVTTKIALPFSVTHFMLSRKQLKQ